MIEQVRVDEFDSSDHALLGSVVGSSDCNGLGDALVDDDTPQVADAVRRLSLQAFHRCIGAAVALYRSRIRRSIRRSSGSLSSKLWTTNAFKEKTMTEDTSVRGTVWFRALTGQMSPMPGDPKSVLTADAPLGDDNARFLCVVPDPHARFPCARN